MVVVVNVAPRKELKMSICQGCGGVVGRDCFNPEECLWITQQQADQAQSYHQSEQEAQHSLQQLKAEIAALVNKLESYSRSQEVDNDFWDIVEAMRQLSAV